MATTKTYTFVNSQPADGTQVNQNFDDLLAGINAIVTNATHTGDATGATALTIAADAVTYAKMQNISATDKILGRVTAGAGNPEEIACTSAGRALIDDANAAAQLITLGVTSTAAELNALDGITPTVTELNYVDGVTSAIQTQLNAKKATATGSVVLSATGETTVTHGLGTTPAFVLVVSSTGGDLYQTNTFTSTTFKIAQDASASTVRWFASA